MIGHRSIFLKADSSSELVTSSMLAAPQKVTLPGIQNSCNQSKKARFAKSTSGGKRNSIFALQSLEHPMLSIGRTDNIQDLFAECPHLLQNKE
jgi:hypothetical protein